MAVTAAISTDVTSKTADALATPMARPGCRSCGTALPINTAFCEACGTPTVLRCDACDSPLADGLGFCEACGQATSGNEPASAEPSPNTPEPTTTSANRAAAASATTTRRRQGAIAGGAIGGLAIVAAAVFGIAKLTGGGNDSRAVAVSELSEEGSSQIDQAPPSDPTTAAAPTTGASRLAGLFEPGSVTGGRCFNRLVNSNSYVILNGVRHNSDFVQCGSLHSGRASASYDLSLPLIDGSTGLKFEGLLVVDESTHLPATVTVRVLANGEEFCRGEATYGRPQRLICDLPASAVNAAGLTFEQKVVPNAAGVFAGLLHPEIRAS